MSSGFMVATLAVHASAASSATSACSIAGEWTRTNEHYTVAEVAASTGKYYVHCSAHAGACHTWTSANLTLTSQHINISFDMLHGPTPHQQTGSLSTDCQDITWSDKTQWNRPRPPPPPPPGYIDPASIDTVYVMQVRARWAE